jgi:hypothetical protein
MKPMHNWKHSVSFAASQSHKKFGIDSFSEYRDGETKKA